jgi:hypothetical protein
MHPELVMFRPNVPVWHKSRAGSKRMTRNTLFLVHVASERRRLPVWPQTDCDSPWIGKSTSAVHGIAEGKVYAHGQSPTDRHCYDMGYMNAYCSGIGAWPPRTAFVMSHRTGSCMPATASCTDCFTNY